MNSSVEKKKKLIAEAKSALNSGKLKPGDARELAESLEEVNEFGFAWRVLKQARESLRADQAPDEDLVLRQKIALFTYKDTHLNDEYRLSRALEILDEGNHLADSQDPETLGLAYYRRGHQKDQAKNFTPRQGYPGINAAFICEQLARIEELTADPASPAMNLVAERRKEAGIIRRDIVNGLEPMLATLAEAYFGLREFDEARRWLDAIARLPDKLPWHFESTAKQLTELSRLLEGDKIQNLDEFAESQAGKALLSFLGDDFAGLQTAFIGKVGLSLSGGGFRASLFHIGVLARLAELDMLKHVEAISCVSGGSIVGAHYYLELRKLLKTTLDKDIKQQDYVKLVERVQRSFLKGVQTNIRMRLLAEWTTNLKMIFLPGYTRTQRLGELYEENLYAEIQDGEQNQPRYISELYILPLDNEKDGQFNPRSQNWGRENKVPTLILNATTLNTGHNWQFTASWMGEPPTMVNPDFDTNYRLRRLHYHEAPDKYSKVRLGTAVGASSCVPGLFEPIELKGLYEHPESAATATGNDSTEMDGEISVRLVDGGVHDNQGIVGLVEQDCNVMLVSDASGQMEAEDNPSNGLLGVPLRTNSILMSRVRDAEYDDLWARLRSGELRNLMFIHMKMDLSSDPVNWVDSDEPEHGTAATQSNQMNSPNTRYGINKQVQQLLAANRTDLDSWSDAEAYALMLSGYRMTEYHFPLDIKGIPLASPEKPMTDWDFLRVDMLQQRADPNSWFMRVLRVGGNTALKVWLLSKPLRLFGIALIVAMTVMIAFLTWKYWEHPLLTVASVGGFVVTAIATAIFGKLVMRIVRFRQTIMKIVIGIAMALAGFLIARLHLHVFDRLYLKLGEIKADSE
jgi:predicted acylesterase/phospholipase RssA